MTLFVNVAVLGGLCATAVLIVRSWWRGKEPMTDSKKTKLSVQMDIAEYNLIRIWADKTGMTLSDYVRKTLVDSVPREEQARADASEGQNNAIDAAFHELDLQEEATPFIPGLMPMPPQRKVQPGVITEAQRTHPMQRVSDTKLSQLPKVPPGPHPCMHLSLAVPAHLRGQCQGVCQHREQTGRACFWTPTQAHGCPVFEPKAQHRKAGARR